MAVFPAVSRDSSGPLFYEISVAFEPALVTDSKANFALIRFRVELKTHCSTIDCANFPRWRIIESGVRVLFNVGWRVGFVND